MGLGLFSRAPLVGGLFSKKAAEADPQKAYPELTPKEIFGGIIQTKWFKALCSVEKVIFRDHLSQCIDRESPLISYDVYLEAICGCMEAILREGGHPVPRMRSAADIVVQEILGKIEASSTDTLDIAEQAFWALNASPEERDQYACAADQVRMERSRVDAQAFGNLF